MACEHTLSPIFTSEGTVVASRALPGRHRLLSIRAPRLAHAIRPGQFVELDCMSPESRKRFDTWRRGLTGWDEIRAFAPTRPDWNPPLIRRPMGYYRAYSESPGAVPDTFDILFKIVGIGTEILAGKRAGETLDLLGPLGNTFDIEDRTRAALLVAGGTGLGPLVAWGEALARMGRKVVLYFGAMSEASIPLTLSGEGKSLQAEEMRALGIETHIAVVEPGRSGLFQGLVTELFAARLEEARKAYRGLQIYTCGPMGMMAAVARIAMQEDILCQALLEERMACGFGGCKGCVCRHRPHETPGAPVRHLRVCIEGPIFDARDIVWD